MKINKLFLLGKSQKNITAYSFVALLCMVMVVGCGGGSGETRTARLILSDYDRLLRPGETTRLTLTTDIEAVFYFNFSSEIPLYLLNTGFDHR
jgi:hypothetical protein